MNKIKATNKQIAAFEIKKNNPDKSMYEVMREAGFSHDTARTPDNLIQSSGWIQLIEDYRKKLEEKGLSSSKIAEKMSEWIDAKDPKGNPLYDTQIKAGNMLREDLGITRKKEEEGEGNTIILNSYTIEELHLKASSLVDEIKELQASV